MRPFGLGIAAFAAAFLAFGVRFVAATLAIALRMHRMSG